jgi:FemAB-related protein (PEP-CTERM system-associated)
MSEVSVRAIGRGEEDARLWRSYVASHPDVTTYHSLAWRAVLETSFGYRSWYLLAQTEDRVVGCLPLFQVTSPLGRRLVAVPFRDRGGVLWSHPDAFHALVREGARILAQQRASFLELKSVVDYPPELLEPHGLRERRYWVRSALDLHEASPKRLLQRVGKKTRNMLRQAERAGLVFTEERDALATWYPLHLITQKDLGLPPFSRRYFANLLRELGPEAARVFVVRRDQVAVAAAIVLLSGMTGSYAYSASLPAGRAFRPNDFMVFNLITWLGEQGFRGFDMGSDAPSQESLLSFKKKWGAEQASIPSYTLGEAADWIADSSSPRYRRLRACFRHLPIPVLRALGGFTTRYFG